MEIDEARNVSGGRHAGSEVLDPRCCTMATPPLPPSSLHSFRARRRRNQVTHPKPARARMNLSSIRLSSPSSSFPAPAVPCRADASHSPHPTSRTCTHAVPTRPPPPFASDARVSAPCVSAAATPCCAVPRLSATPSARRTPRRRRCCLKRKKEEARADAHARRRRAGPRPRLRRSVDAAASVWTSGRMTSSGWRLAGMLWCGYAWSRGSMYAPLAAPPSQHDHAPTTPSLRPSIM